MCIGVNPQAKPPRPKFKVKKLLIKHTYRYLLHKHRVYIMVDLACKDYLRSHCAAI